MEVTLSGVVLAGLPPTNPNRPIGPPPSLSEPLECGASGLGQTVPREFYELISNRHDNSRAPPSLARPYNRQGEFHRTLR